MHAGAEHVYRGLDEPVEGTIITVARDAAEAARMAATGTRDFGHFMREVLLKAQQSLSRTPELLAVLKEAGVVDAGAKGFVRLLEGIVRLIDGDPIVAVKETPAYAVPDAAAMASVAADQDYQYCTQVLVRGADLPATTQVRAALRELGGSIVVLGTGELLKVHVHTDHPSRVTELARSWGSIEESSAQDMREQHTDLLTTQRRVALVVDSTCDLPDELVDRHGIVIVPVQVIDGDEAYLDRVEVQAEDLYLRMRKGDTFTTSQPPPGTIVRTFQDALCDADRVLALFLGSKLSGTYQSAQVAAGAVDGSVTTFDSRTASLGLGLLTLRAAELIEEGHPIPDVVAEMDRIRDRSGAFFTVDTFENLLRSGRVGRGRAWLGGILDIKPILEVTPEGTVAPLDRVRGSEALIPRVLEHLERRLTPRPARLRMGVVHADAADIAKQLREEFERRFDPIDVLTHAVTAALGVHVGPGAWGVFFQIEEPAPTS
jgi:DegV family protein with EDD domain